MGRLPSTNLVLIGQKRAFFWEETACLVCDAERATDYRIDPTRSLIPRRIPNWGLLMPMDLIDLHAAPERWDIFKSPDEPFAFDSKLKIYATLTPEASSAVFQSPDWHVIPYHQLYERLAGKLNLDFTECTFVLSKMPLANEGREHKDLRRQLASHIAERLPLVQRNLPDIVGRCIEPFKSPGEFDVMQPCVEPLVSDIMAHVCGVPSIESAMNVSRVFDAFLSMRGRSQVEQGLCRLRQVAEGMTSLSDPKLIEIAMVLHVVGADSLAGSIGQSLWRVFDQHSGEPLSSIPWPDSFPETGVPFLDRIAVNDNEICGHAFRKGDRMRVYILPFVRNETSADHDKIYGSGRHVCVGKRLSGLIWAEWTKQMEGIDRSASVVTHDLRPSDYVFNYPEPLVVRVS